MIKSMNGLVNLYGINDINTTGNINSKSYESSNALYFTTLSGNIQFQLNSLLPLLLRSDNLFNGINSFNSITTPSLSIINNPKAFIYYTCDTYNNLALLNKDTNIYDGIFSNIGIISTVLPAVGTSCLLMNNNYFITLPLYTNSIYGFTICFWVSSISNASYSRIIDYGSAMRIFILRNSLCISTNNNGAEIILHYNFNDGVFRHYALVFNVDGTINVYVNGVFYCIITTFGYPIINQIGYIGKSFGSDPLFSGKLDDIRIYDTLLSASAINKIYNNLFFYSLIPSIDILGNLRFNSITEITPTQMTYLSGATSNIQNQINSFTSKIYNVSLSGLINNQIIIDNIQNNNILSLSGLIYGNYIKQNTMNSNISTLQNQVNNILTNNITIYGIKTFDNDIMMTYGRNLFLSSDKYHYFGFNNRQITNGPSVIGYRGVTLGYINPQISNENALIIDNTGLSVNVIGGLIKLNTQSITENMINYLSNVNTDIQIQFNTISSTVYNQNIMNTNQIYNIISLSGLIYNNYNSQQSIINNFFQIQYSENQFLQNQINNNNKKQSQTSNGNIAGNVLNGVATMATGIASAFLFTIVFGALATQQAQIGILQTEMVDMQGVIGDLQYQIRRLQSYVSTLFKKVETLETKCIYLNGVNFSSDLIIQGNIQQITPIGLNVFGSNTSMQQNLSVTGFSVKNISTINDFIQFSV